MPGIRKISVTEGANRHRPSIYISCAYFFNLSALIFSSSLKLDTPHSSHFSLITTNLPTNTNNTAKMTELKAGDNFPEGVFFSYIPPTPEISKFSTCGTPVPYNASQGT